MYATSVRCAMPLPRPLHRQTRGRPAHARCGGDRTGICARDQRREPAGRRVALGYKQLLEAKRLFRDLEGILQLRPSSGRTRQHHDLPSHASARPTHRNQHRRGPAHDRRRRTRSDLPGAGPFRSTDRGFNQTASSPTADNTATPLPCRCRTTTPRRITPPTAGVGTRPNTAQPRAHTGSRAPRMTAPRGGT